MAISIVAARARSMVDDLVGSSGLDGGTGNAKIKIYSGSVPADADAALSGNTLLSTVTFQDPAFAAATTVGDRARATANTVSGKVGEDTNAAATGTATFYRATDASDNVVWQGTVATSGADLILSNTSITQSGTVTITSAQIELPEFDGATN